jgi:hypothetical protein
VVRYVQMPTGAVDTQLLEDATRRGPYSFLARNSVTKIGDGVANLRLLRMGDVEAKDNKK